MTPPKIVGIGYLEYYYVPTDEEWLRIKLIFIVTMNIYITFISHALYMHLLISNNVTISLTQCVGSDHPIRLLLRPFTFLSDDPSYDAVVFLLSSEGELVTVFGLSPKGCNDLIKHAVESFEYKSFNQDIRDRGCESISKSVYLYGLDGLYVFERIKNLIKSYVEFYYKDDAEVRDDDELQKFIIAYENSLKLLGVKNYKIKLDTTMDLIEFCAQFLFSVMAIHQNIGFNSQYTDIAALYQSATYIRRSELVITPNNITRILPPKSIYYTKWVASASTNLPAPKAINDFSQMSFDAESRKFWVHDYIDTLKNISSEIQSRNLKRDRPFVDFDPSQWNCSASH